MNILLLFRYSLTRIIHFVLDILYLIFFTVWIHLFDSNIVCEIFCMSHILLFSTCFDRFSFECIWFNSFKLWWLRKFIVITQEFISIRNCDVKIINIKFYLDWQITKESCVYISMKNQLNIIWTNTHFWFNKNSLSFFH